MKKEIAIRFSILTLICCVFSFSKIGATANDSTQTNCIQLGKNVPIGILASGYVEKGKWNFSYLFSDLHHKGNKMGTEKITDDFVFTHYGNMMSPKKMSMKIHFFSAMYGLGNRFSAMGIVSLRTNMMDMKPMPAYLVEDLTGMNMANMNMPTYCQAAGLGDTKIYLFYKLVQKCNYSIILGSGVNIPTGSIKKNGPTITGKDKRLAYAMQMGTGTFDLIPNINFVGRHLSWNYGVEALADITPSNNRIGYSYGNQFNINTWASYRFFSNFCASVRIKGTSQGEIFGFDPALYLNMYNDPTDNPANYGGKSAVAFAGFNFDIYNENSKDLAVKLEYGIPFYQNLNGIQMRTSSVFQFGINFSY